MAFGRRRRARRTDDDGTTRTYGPWGLVWVFAGLALLGLFVLLFIRPTEDESVRVPTSQTLPDGYEDPTAATEPGEGSAPTLPGGAPLPEGVSSVDVRDGTISLTFDPPPGATTDSGELAPGWTAQIGAASAEPTAGGDELVVRVPCSRAQDEFLAQLTITESDTAVTVAAVVVAPDGGGPCVDTQDRHVYTLRLTEPLGDRQLTIVPEGTPIEPGAGASDATS